MRSARRDDSSLELLLDTITNTFGGILFLAILIALIVRTTAPRDAATPVRDEPLSAAEAARFEVRVRELTADLAAVRRRMAEQRPSAAEAPTVSTAALDECTRRLEEATLARADTLQRTVRLQREADEAIARAEEIDAQGAAVDEQLAEAAARREAAVAEAADLVRAALEVDAFAGATVIEQTVGLPRIRPTDKDEVAFYVRFGRLYMMHHWDRGIRVGPNTDHFVVVSGPPQVARPKPNAGIVIAPASIDREVARMLAPFQPQRYYVTCVVFEDSFDVFQSLKAALVRQGFEYRPIARRPGQPVYDTGGSGEAQ